MATKYCPRCKETKDVSDFTKSASRKDGLQHYCSECMKAYRKEHYYKNKQPYKDRAIEAKRRMRLHVQNLKESPCADCGESYPEEPWLMEFDHLDPELKVGDIGAIVRTGSFKQLTAELDKCDLLCVVCHRRRTANRAGWTKLTSM